MNQNLSQRLHRIKENIRSFLGEIGANSDCIPLTELDDAEDLIQTLRVIIKSLLHDRECGLREIKRLKKDRDILWRQALDTQKERETLEKEYLILETKISVLRKEMRKRKKRRGLEE